MKVAIHWPELTYLQGLYHAKPFTCKRWDKFFLLEDVLELKSSQKSRPVIFQEFQASKA